MAHLLHESCIVCHTETSVPSHSRKLLSNLHAISSYTPENSINSHARHQKKTVLLSFVKTERATIVEENSIAEKTMLMLKGF